MIALPVGAKPRVCNAVRAGGFEGASEEQAEAHKSNHLDAHDRTPLLISGTKVPFHRFRTSSWLGQNGFVREENGFVGTPSVKHFTSAIFCRPLLVAWGSSLSRVSGIKNLLLAPHRPVGPCGAFGDEISLPDSTAEYPRRG